MAQIDWSQLMAQAAAEGYSNEILPDGSYEVQVAGVRVGAAQGGKPQIGVRLKVVSGPLTNKSIWDNLTISSENPKAMAVFFRKCNDYGAPQEAFAAGEGLDQIAARFVGRTGTAVVGHREYNQKTYNTVVSFKPSASATPPVQGLSASPAVTVAATFPNTQAAFTSPQLGAPVGAPSF
jgi:hypothetical protein